jgi:hypothetical protein
VGREPERGIEGDGGMWEGGTGMLRRKGARVEIRM